MAVVAQYHRLLLLQITLALHGANGLWSSEQRQQVPQHFQPRQECCRSDNYIGLVPPKPPVYNPYQNKGFHHHPTIYPEDYHNKHNPYNRRYLAAKDYYRKGQNQIPPYIQRRTGFVITNDYYNKRPYAKPDDRFNFRNPQINYRPYYDERYVYNDKEVQSDPHYRDKYSPGIFLSSVAERQGTIIVTDPDGVKHRIHSTSLQELDLPESSKPFYFSPDSIGAPKPSPDFGISSAKSPYMHSSPPKVPGHDNASGIPNPYREHMHNNGYAIRFPSDEKTSYKNGFHPSPPFHKYSEPDPLFHPNGSPLQTHTSPPTTGGAVPTPRRTPAYPDSINAQLPPASDNEQSQVPYVPDSRVSSATQASQATQKKPSLTEIAPTKPTSFSPFRNEIISSTTQQPTREEQKKWDFLPTVQEGSSSSKPLDGSTSPSTQTPTVASASNLNSDPIVSSPTAETAIKLQQEQTTTATSIQAEVQTNGYSTDSDLLPVTSELHNIENVTKLDELYFNAISTTTLQEETLTTMMPYY